MGRRQKNEIHSSDGVTQMVIVALRRIIRAIDLRSRQLATRCGLTGPQLVLLKELSVQDGISVGTLARSVHLSHATVTGILDRLAKRGLVQRQRGNEDKRRMLVWLTDSGTELLADAPPLLQEEFTEEFAQLEPWEQTQILASLQRVVSMMEARHIEATPMLTTGPIDTTSEKTKAFLDRGAAKQPETPPSSTPTDSLSATVTDEPPTD